MSDNNIDSSEVIHIHSQIVCSSFNADGSCVCIGTKSSFSIYNTNPATKRFTNSKQGGLRVIELHYNSALVACVPTGEKAGVSPRKLILFDCIQNKKLSELAFPSTIRMCHMNNENLLVILDSQLYIYDIWSLALMTLIEIEKGGYVSLSTGIKSILSAPIPSNNVGCISIFEYSRSEIKKLCDIQAHKNKIASSYISTSGHLIATCSSNGTLVKVFSTADGVLIGTYRRGFHHVFVNSISICPNDEYLSVGSSSGTVHIFAIKSNHNDNNPNHNHNNLNNERQSTNSRNSIEKSTSNHNNNNNNNHNNSSNDALKGVKSNAESSHYGLKLAHEFRIFERLNRSSSQNKTTIIAMCSEFNGSMLTEAMNAGYDGFIAKPIDVADLLSIVLMCDSKKNTIDKNSL
uniref:Autophagy-related protein 18 n=1 Tax=Chromulina nebulosa TaxID=96789 RepID=A0A7S0SV72_9STRA|mmetsp:Transcript_2213/g.1981  ORF Transcript_2213/g.1981 Transcript_2213/m.1981 type:complete len:404 (+) Transcript_2213:32-1243(+)